MSAIAGYQSHCKFFNANEEKALAATVERKMIARCKPVAVDRSDAGNSFAKRFTRFNRSIDNALKTPCSNQSFFKKTRITTEQKLALAAFSYFLENYCDNTNKSADDLAKEFSTFLDISTQNVNKTLSSPESAQFKNRVDLFWQGFLRSKPGRKALNNSSFLFTHPNYANSNVAMKMLGVARSLDGIGHLTLAPSTIFTKNYRHMINQLKHKTGIVHSCSYLVGAGTTLTVLGLLRAFEVMSLPVAYVVLLPAYSSASVLTLFAKVVDSIAFHLSNKELHKNQKTNDMVVQMTNNRLVEMLDLFSKTQNHFNQSVLNENLNPRAAAQCQMAQKYAKEITTKKSNNLCSSLARMVKSKDEPLYEMTLSIRESSKRFSQSLIVNADNVDQPIQASFQSVIWHAVSTYQAGLVKINDKSANTSGDPSKFELIAKQKLLKHQMRAMFGASRIFSNLRGGKFIHDFAREEDVDRIVLDENNNKVWLDGDNHFQDRQIRTHLEYLMHWAYDKIRLNLALTLCKLAGTEIHRSVKEKMINVDNQIVKKYQGIQGVLHKVARSISVRTDETDVHTLRDNLPFIRSWTNRPQHIVTYKVKKERSSHHHKFGKVDSLSYIHKNPQRYSKLTNTLMQIHLKLQDVAEHYLQPARGNCGRFVDKFIVQKITGKVGGSVRHSLSYAASVLFWASVLTPAVSVPLYLGGLFIPTFLGSMTGFLSLFVASLTLMSAHRSLWEKPMI